MKKIFTTLCFLSFALSSSFAITFVSYEGFTNPTAGTLCVWINTDANFGEGVQAQIRYGAGPTFSGFITGSFDDTSFPGANWKVTIPYPTDVASVDIEIAGCTDFNNCQGSGTLFSGFVNTATNLLLPVELSSFKAETNKKNVELQWTTISEYNNSHFDVQRSTDSKRWVTIDQINGQGFSSEKIEYNFTDRQPITGTNYYRLKQNDFDDHFEYSDIISVDFGQSSSITIQPNPAKNEIFISADFNQHEPNLISIYNVNGQRVLTTKHGLTNSLSINTLNSGLYYLQIFDANNNLVGQERFIKN